MNKLSIGKQKQIIHLLVEGNSLRSTSRIVDCSINTVMKLLVDVGKACAYYQYDNLRNLNCKYLQVDEIWSFCYSREQNTPLDKKDKFSHGNVWTWVAIDANTKLVPCWFVGTRELSSAKIFIKDLASRLSSRIQLTSDGLKAYVEAVEDSFHGNIDYALLVKLYNNPPSEEFHSGRNYYAGHKIKISAGNPDKEFINTSFIERQNLTMRMCMRRFTRKTNAFSKKIENHEYAIALHFMYYNYCRIHKTLRVTPAMEAGISDYVWEIEEILELKNKFSN